MATTKKPAAKKPVAKKAPAKTVTKKTTVKKSASTVTVAKKAPVKKATASKSAKAGYRSFKVSAANEPFTSFKITRQTVYWIILIAFIIFVQLWILKLQIEVTTLLEQQQTELLNSM